MKDNRDKQMAQLAGWTWDLTGYAEKVPFYNADDLTMREVQNVFQLDPEPPQMELNGYIGEAVRKRDLSYFSSVSYTHLCSCVCCRSCSCCTS